MQSSLLPRSWARCALLLPVLLACADRRHTVPYYDYRDASTLAGTARDPFLGVRGTKKKKPGQFSIVLPCDLWGPFRWEVSAGRLDPDHFAGGEGAVFGTELDGRGSFPPTVFYGIAAQIFSTGLNVYAYSHLSSQAIGTTFFPGATEVDFAIESNGSQLTFFARKRGDPAFTQIAQIAFTQTEPVVPTIGGFNLFNKAAVGFDDFRIVQNSAPPGTPTAEQTAAAGICDALVALMDAQTAIDGIGPDWTAADGHVAGAIAAIDGAHGLVSALPKSKARKKSLALLEKARKQAVSAQKAIAAQKEGKITKTITKLRKAAVFAGKASLKIYPFS